VTSSFYLKSTSTMILTLN